MICKTSLNVFSFATEKLIKGIKLFFKGKTNSKLRSFFKYIGLGSLIQFSDQPPIFGDRIFQHKIMGDQRIGSNRCTCLEIGFRSEEHTSVLQSRGHLV